LYYIIVLCSTALHDSIILCM